MKGPTLAFIAIPSFDCRLGDTHSLTHTHVHTVGERVCVCDRETKRERESLQAVYGGLKKGQLYQFKKKIKADKAERDPTLFFFYFFTTEVLLD